MSLQDDIKKLRAILTETLTPKELQVIRLRYALDGEEEMPQRMIGQMLGISRSYVSRIEKRLCENFGPDLRMTQQGKMLGR